jgi:hypothetical protein
MNMRGKKQSSPILLYYDDTGTHKIICQLHISYLKDGQTGKCYKQTLGYYFDLRQLIILYGPCIILQYIYVIEQDIQCIVIEFIHNT